MLGSIGGEYVGLVRSREYEGLSRQRRGVIESFSKQGMSLAAIGTMQFVEQKVVVQIRAKSLRRGHADVDLVAKEGCRNRIPGRDVDQDLHLGMVVVEPGYGRVKALTHQARDDLNRDLTPHVLGNIAEPLGDVTHQCAKGAAGLGDQHAFVGQFEATGAAPAKLHVERVLESLKRETESGLFAPERSAGTADAAGLHDLVKSFEQIPIDTAREIDRRAEHHCTPLSVIPAVCRHRWTISLKKADCGSTERGLSW